MAILSTGADIRLDGCERGCHFSLAGQIRTRPTNWRVRAHVSFFTRGDPQISKISDFDGFDLAQQYPLLMSRTVTLGVIHLTHQPRSFLGAPIRRSFVIEFTSTLLKLVGDLKPA
jgi:hypothetical protein